MNTKTLIESYNSNLSNSRDYLICLEKLDDMINELPDLDEESYDFFEKISDLIAEETSRATKILSNEENKRMNSLDGNKKPKRVKKEKTSKEEQPKEEVKKEEPKKSSDSYKPFDGFDEDLPF